jgi:hypothetical protein
MYCPTMLKLEGVEAVRWPPRSPNLVALAPNNATYYSTVVGCHVHPERSGGWACSRKREHGTPHGTLLHDLLPEPLTPPIERSLRSINEEGLLQLTFFGET